MSLLRRKPKLSPLTQIDADARWALAERPAPGGPLFMRLNLSVEPLAGHPDYGDWMLIVAPFRDADEQGLPGLDEMEELGRLEDAMVDVLGADLLCVLAVISTHSGERKFVFYTRDRDAATMLVEEVALSFPEHDISYGFGADPAWSVYCGYIKALR
jgi:hypothetical protein